MPSVVPMDNRYYASGVQHHVQVFAVSDKRQLKQLTGAPAKVEESSGLWQPIACAAEGQRPSFCGDCLERAPACVCRLSDVNKPLHANVHALERDHGTSVEVCVDDLSEKEHVRKKHRKDNRKRKWEKQRLQAAPKNPLSGKDHDVCRGEDASELVLRDLLDFL